jgi:hypothetical protein
MIIFGATGTMRSKLPYFFFRKQWFFHEKFRAKSALPGNKYFSWPIY